MGLMGSIRPLRLHQELDYWPLSCWTRIYLAFANRVDSDQLSSEEANRSESALFVIQNVNLYQHSGSSNLTGWELEVCVLSLFIQHDNG